MTKRDKRDLLFEVSERLEKMYPDAECALHYGGDPWRLLIMARLSAQCTDARVNEVSVELFRVFPTPEAMADGDISEIERIVKPCGLYRMKAANIKDCSRELIERYGGVLPSEIDELVTLSGVGRKIANLIVGDVYGKDAIVCDTHCMRICGRLGAYPEGLADPVKIERLLRDLMDPSKGSDFCHRIVLFGREVCSARSPRCDECPMADICRYNLKKARKAENVK